MATTNPERSITARPDAVAVSFPDDFVWGVATAAYQIEGSPAADGRLPSIWDTFSHEPGRTLNGDTGDDACDHYQRWREDIAIMAGVGVHAYRFSVAWPRVLPTGAGEVNKHGLDFYNRLVDELLARGIQPFVTLYHWDLPQALQDAGGWPARATAYRFADYAAVVFDALGDRVRHWITHNEPLATVVLGHLIGEYAPGLQDAKATAAAHHHVLLGHGLAVQALRASGRDGLVGVANVATAYEPASDSLEDRAACEAARGDSNDSFLDPLFGFGYPRGGRLWGHELPVDPGDMEIVAMPVDFIGVNHYTRLLVAHDPESGRYRIFHGELPKTDMGWEISPRSFAEELLRVSQRYRTPIYVTENGMADCSSFGPEGTVDDEERIAFLRAYLQNMAAAIEEGADVRGYFLWTLLDNFEWSHGYSKRFGIVAVDRATQQRTPKRSAAWYRELITANALVSA